MDAVVDPVKVLSLEDFKAVDAERKVEPVDVPEWNGRVFVRELSALERDQLDGSLYQEGQTAIEIGDYRTRVVAACLCTEDGSPFFKAGDAAAARLVGRKSPAPFRRVYAAAARLNRLRQEDADAGKGDSGGTPAAGSPSVSPSPPAA